MFRSGACYLDLYAYDEAVQDWRHMGPIGGGFGGDDGGTPFYNLQVLYLRLCCSLSLSCTCACLRAICDAFMLAMSRPCVAALLPCYYWYATANNEVARSLCITVGRHHWRHPFYLHQKEHHLPTLPTCPGDAAR